MDGKHKLFSKVFCPTIQIKTDIRADWRLALPMPKISSGLLYVSHSIPPIFPITFH